MGIVMLNGKQYNTTVKGVSMVNYSTTEQIVGTWIDGRPVYENTISISRLAFPSNQWTWFSLSFDGDFIIDSEVYYKSSLGDYSYSNLPLAINYSNGDIGIYNNVGGNLGEGSGYLTIRYVKTAS